MKPPRKRNKALYKTHNLKSRYGIDEKQYDAMLRKQKGKCLICGKKEKLSVDHCHQTGKIRGLLCRECNLALGKLSDNISILCSAIKYLNEKGKP